jgi:hypothetical protein
MTPDTTHLASSARPRSTPSITSAEKYAPAVSAPVFIFRTERSPRCTTHSKDLLVHPFLREIRLPELVLKDAGRDAESPTCLFAVGGPAFGRDLYARPMGSPRPGKGAQAKGRLLAFDGTYGRPAGASTPGNTSRSSGMRARPSMRPQMLRMIRMRSSGRRKRSTAGGV